MAKVLLRAIGALALFAAMPLTVHAQTSTINKTSPYVQITLRQQLRQGLKCRRPVEFEFVDYVADLVDAGKLPIDLVNICFDWSRQRNSFRPFVYFQRSLIILAKQKGFQVEG